MSDNQAEQCSAPPKLDRLENEIEHLAPALAEDDPNAEYPWEDSREKVYAPAEYPFPVLTNLKSPKGCNLMKFIRIFFEYFEVLF